MLLNDFLHDLFKPRNHPAHRRDAVHPDTLHVLHTQREMSIFLFNTDEIRLRLPQPLLLEIRAQFRPPPREERIPETDYPNTVPIHARPHLHCFPPVRDHKWRGYKVEQELRGNCPYNVVHPLWQAG